MARKPDKNKKHPKVNAELEGFDLRVDSFGEIRSNLSVDKINEFLNRNVDDKKLRDRGGLPEEEEDEDDEERTPKGKKKIKPREKNRNKGEEDY